MVHNCSPNNFCSLCCQPSVYWLLMLIFVPGIYVATFTGMKEVWYPGHITSIPSLAIQGGDLLHIIPPLIYDVLMRRTALSSSASPHWTWWSAVSLAGDCLAHLKDNEFLFLLLQTDLIQHMAAKTVFDTVKIVGGYSQERRDQHLQLDKVRNNIKLQH